MISRIALANIRYPDNAEHSVELAVNAVVEAGAAHADIICFPECYIPGYRVPGAGDVWPSLEFLDQSWSKIALAAGKANVAVVLGTDRIVGDKLLISAIVIGNDGNVIGFQDKVQLDPSEDTGYSAGVGRRVFNVGELTFGISICHEGWRYPETVRYPVTQGARLVFHPHYHAAEPGSYRPTAFADPQNTFHEKAALCRAAENTCYFATVNYASEGSPTTSAFINPDGTVYSYQPYGEEGLLIADIDLDAATGLLASRYNPI